MSYKIDYSQKAEKDIAELMRSGNKPLLQKLTNLLSELEIHPQTGTGKPERLKHGKSGLWSRRISGEHRLVYSIEENIVKVIVISAKGHY
ncbi:MAG: Txe/YoeB family addiction module toxin [Chitinivibrionia bacterium]|nr:Txe/YoeB family addiction module toxin [Chitinivibrionia bacterium]